MATPDPKDNTLVYFLSEKAPFLVVSFVGLISKTTEAELDKCTKEVAEKQDSLVVLNLRDVTKLELGGVPAFVRLQKAIRDKGAKLRLCSVRPDIKQFLVEKGAIRPDEISNNLREALEQLKSKS